MIGSSRDIDLHNKLYALYKAASLPDPEEQKIQKEFKALSKDRTGTGDRRSDALLDRYRRLIELSLQRARQRHTPEAAETARRRPIVLTSMNPFGRKALQLRCYKKWQDLGFDVYTCNHGSEVAPLIEMGVAKDSIIELGLHETGQSIHGKPIPKIMAVLNRAYAGFDRSVLLVNSDLYPAGQDDRFLNIWQKKEVPLALTRQEVLAIDAPVRAVSRPYRGGLDAFLIPWHKLWALIEALALFSASQRMCFGVPGWDFFVGAVLHKKLNGEMRDSNILFHEMHPTTYQNIAEFDFYTSAFHALGIGLGQNYSGVGTEFKNLIDSECDAQIEDDAGVDLALFKSTGKYSRDAASLLSRIEGNAPQLAHSFGYDTVRDVISAIDLRTDLSFPDAVQRFDTVEIKKSYANILLLCVLFIALRKPDPQKLTEKYPQGNQHAAAVRMISSISASHPDLFRTEIAKLFCTELMAYHIFNRRLFNVLALSCENDAERWLLSEIRDFIEKKETHAT